MAIKVRYRALIHEQDTLFSVLGRSAQPIPPRPSLRKRPPQAAGLSGLDREHVPARECGLDFRPRYATDEGTRTGGLKGEHQQCGTRIGKRGDTTALSDTLLRAQALETADVKKEIEHAQAGRRKVGHVTHHESGAADALALRRVDRVWNVVDANSLPAPAGEFMSLQATATAKIKGPTKRPGTLCLLPVQQGRSTRRRRRPIALPRSEPEAIRQGVSSGHARHRVDLPAHIDCL